MCICTPHRRGYLFVFRSVGIFRELWQLARPANIQTDNCLNMSFLYRKYFYAYSLSCSIHLSTSRTNRAISSRLFAYCFLIRSYPTGNAQILIGSFKLFYQNLLLAIFLRQFLICFVGCIQLFLQGRGNAPQEFAVCLAIVQKFPTNFQPFRTQISTKVGFFPNPESKTANILLFQTSMTILLSRSS